MTSFSRLFMFFIALLTWLALNCVKPHKISPTWSSTASKLYLFFWRKRKIEFVFRFICLFFPHPPYRHFFGLFQCVRSTSPKSWQIGHSETFDWSDLSNIANLSLQRLWFYRKHNVFFVYRIKHFSNVLSKY